MRIYSDVLGAGDLHGASIGLPLYLDTVRELRRPRLRARGWRVRVLGYGNRQSNTGIYGASGEAAASWDDHGRFFARIFQRDPRALIVAAARYDGREDFHVQTNDKYLGEVIA